MADLQSKMSAHQKDIDNARVQIEDTTQKADSYLTELTKRVEEYEKKHASFEPASQYLKSALDASRLATQKLNTQGQEMSDRSVPVALEGMNAVRKSLEDLQKQAVAYDDKYAGSHGQESMDTLHGCVNAGRQRAIDAMETTSEQLTKLRDAIGNMAGQATYGAQVVVGEAVRAAEFKDEKLGVSNAAGEAVQKIRDLDTLLGVTAAAKMVDTKITGGIGCKMAATTVNIVNDSVGYISETLQNAEMAAQHSELAQDAEVKGAAVTDAAVVKKNDLQQIFTEAYEESKGRFEMSVEKTEQKADEVKETTSEKAGQAKNLAKDQAEQVKDKAGEVKESTEEKAGQAKDMAKDKAGQVKDKAGEVKESTEEKAGQAKDMAKEKAGQVKDKAGEVCERSEAKAGQTKEMVEDESGQAKDKAGELTDSAKEKARQTKEVTKDKAGEAADTNQEVRQTEPEKPGVVGRTVDKAKDLKDNAKERVAGVVSAAKNLGTRVEAKATKSKEPSVTQEETTTEKALEAVKQTRAKESEAAKTAAGTARKEMYDKHANVESTGGECDTPGFKQAQQHVAKSSK